MSHFTPDQCSSVLLHASYSTNTDVEFVTCENQSWKQTGVPTGKANSYVSHTRDSPSHSPVHLGHVKNDWRQQVLTVPIDPGFKRKSASCRPPEAPASSSLRPALALPRAPCVATHVVCLLVRDGFVLVLNFWQKLLKVILKGRVACCFGSGNHFSKPSSYYRKAILFLELLTWSSGIL